MNTSVATVIDCFHKTRYRGKLRQVCFCIESWWWSGWAAQLLHPQGLASLVLWPSAFFVSSAVLGGSVHVWVARPPPDCICQAPVSEVRQEWSGSHAFLRIFSLGVSSQVSCIAGGRYVVPVASQKLAHSSPQKGSPDGQRKRGNRWASSSHSNVQGSENAPITAPPSDVFCPRFCPFSLRGGWKIQFSRCTFWAKAKTKRGGHLAMMTQWRPLLLWLCSSVVATVSGHLGL